MNIFFQISKRKIEDLKKIIYKKFNFTYLFEKIIFFISILLLLFYFYVVVIFVVVIQTYLLELTYQIIVFFYALTLLFLLSLLKFLNCVLYSYKTFIY